jgi:hypothetical protein
MNWYSRPAAFIFLTLQVVGTIVLFASLLASPKNDVPQMILIGGVILCAAESLLSFRRRWTNPDLHVVFEHASDLVMVIDMRGDSRCIYASPSYRSYRTVLGYDPSTLVGRSSTVLVHPDDAALALEHHRKLTPGTSG